MNRPARPSPNFEDHWPRLMMAWGALVGMACTVRVATSPEAGLPSPATALIYLLLLAAPAGSMVLAMRLWGSGSASAFASTERRPSGLILALLAGLLMNILLRTMTYLAALPALSSNVPAWLSALRLAMTVDVLLFTSLYAAAFAAALRCANVFPRLLLAIWLGDLVMQSFIGSVIGARPDLPEAVSSALHQMVGANVAKLLLSAALWLPYLLWSKRIAATYRA